MASTSQPPLPRTVCTLGPCSDRLHGVRAQPCERFEAGFGLVAILSEGEAARCRSLLRPGELRVQTDAAPAIWAAGCHFSTQLARPHAAGGGKQVLRPPPLKIASTAEHVRRVVTRAREGHGGRKADTKDVDETGEARSTAPRARRRGGR